jgi:hypothetical protein
LVTPVTEARPPPAQTCQARDGVFKSTSCPKKFGNDSGLDTEDQRTHETAKQQHIYKQYMAQIKKIPDDKERETAIRVLQDAMEQYTKRMP